jgi:tRNA (mo5U34)-methyltransferase
MSTDSVDELSRQVKRLAPWHHDIELTTDLSTGRVFSESGTLTQAENEGVSLISPRRRFFARMKRLFPDGLSGQHFLDCACNAGAYCFWARELDAARIVGFDVREHWINQAKFVQQHRTFAPVDRIEFHVKDLYDVPRLELRPFDLTYFSGIFYHLPDPITGLKIAADLTRDILILNTAMMPNPDNPRGMTMARESRTLVMSGVHELAWFPNGPETLRDILLWAGFKEQKISMHNIKKDVPRSRIEIIAARERGRLEEFEGETLV